MSQKRDVWAPSSTTRCQPCVLPALGAREPRSTSSSSRAGGTGRVSKDRVIRRARTTSANSAIVVLRAAAELDEVFGHRPAVDDEGAALVGRDLGEQLLARGVDALRLRRLVVDEPVLAVLADDERLLVVLALDAEAL